MVVEDGGREGVIKGEVRGGLRVTARFKVVYTALVKVNALPCRCTHLFSKKKGRDLNSIVEMTFKKHRNGNNLTLGLQFFTARFAGLTRRCWRNF